MEASGEAIAELWWDAGAILGEGPTWDHRQKCLYWVDIEGERLHRWEPSGDKRQYWELGGMTGAVVPTEDGFLLLAHESGLHRFDPDSGSMDPLHVMEDLDPNLRFNDGKCDGFGNLWIGTMHKKSLAGAGNLYRIDPRLRPECILPGTSISNGMAWSADHRLFYYIDTPTFEVWCFEYDPESRSIFNKNVAIRIPKEAGSPDGMTIDREGMLWVAHWGGHSIRRWNPENGELLRTVSVAAPHVTSCCFGGENLDTLYITTARSGLSESEIRSFPGSGGVFMYRPGVEGIPIHFFDLKT